MDELTNRLKGKKHQEEVIDPKKKGKIMDMHATGEEINYIRCDLCSERFPASALQEYNGVYYCAGCIEKAKTMKNEEPSEETEDAEGFLERNEESKEPAEDAEGFLERNEE